MADLRAHFAQLTAQAPANPEAERVFLARRAQMAEAFHATQPEGSEQRDRAFRTLARAVGVSPKEGARAVREATGAIPGGAGEGVYYRLLEGPTGFVDPFQYGTAIVFDILAPTVPGGNVDTFLYLTATNRAGLGVEAFVSYEGQGDTRFKVFEWALWGGGPDTWTGMVETPWQFDVPLSDLTDYLHTRDLHGATYQVLPVWNSTWRLDDATWRNTVRLHHTTNETWDLVYQFDYPAVDLDQQIPWVDTASTFAGSWGPIVETFQETYVGTTPMGFASIQLVTADIGGGWGDWVPVSDDNTYFRGLAHGFSHVFVDPNYAYAVTS